MAVGPDTVAVAPAELAGRLYPTLPDFVDNASIVVRAAFVGGSSLAREVQLPATAEGVQPGDGPTTYGVLEFRVLDRVAQGSAEVGCPACGVREW